MSSTNTYKKIYISFLLVCSLVMTLTGGVMLILDYGTTDTYDENIIQDDRDQLITDSLKDKSNEVVLGINSSSKPVKLTIKSVSIEGDIVYGSDGSNLLTEGFWNYPASSMPGDIGISYIFGHRRDKVPPEKETFYNLDKVKLGDQIIISTEDGQRYNFKVTNKEDITPTQLEENMNKESKEHILKLVTCTPLGSDEMRLIITAKRQE